ncbi:MAG: ferric reductase-like transmembrane domain-containing protein [Candidatus Accumulibacter sp.]|jgi:predicted ferric reductase|nr:ferric reductase-like transmembrane domain-containing protein [Accumulibacter sp.]
MKPVRFTLWGLLLALTAAWLLANTFYPRPFTYFALCDALTQYTGIIAVAAMSVSLLLASRPGWLEPRLGGLDKMYRLHKWLGITGLCAAVTHWCWDLGTKMMLAWGKLTGPEQEKPSVDSSPIESWLYAQRELAEDVGEWAFYVAVILIALALVKRFPYHRFIRTHKWLALLFIVFAWHGLVLMKFSYWTQPIGWLIAILLGSGVFAALWILLGKTGEKHKTRGKVASLTHYPEAKTLELEIEPEPGWPGHEAGQFAFVTLRAGEGAHPYTIASAWTSASRRLSFVIKALGDHTHAIREDLRAGEPVTVEGPYGCFTFGGTQKRQIWIGAGIGITPFIARMKHLAQTPGTRDIDLFHPTRVCPPEAFEKLHADARSAGVRLHVILSSRDGRLTGEKIRAAVPDWQKASIWFCGPSALADALKTDFIAHGLKADAFHQELFEMR